MVEIPGMEGKWLKMESNATYKLKELFEIPQNATIEFDLVTRTDKPSVYESYCLVFLKIIVLEIGFQMPIIIILLLLQTSIFGIKLLGVQAAIHELTITWIFL